MNDPLTAGGFVHADQSETWLRRQDADLAAAKRSRTFEPTKQQHETFCALAEVYASVQVERLAPMGAMLCLARCLDGDGRELQAVYVYADGSTRLNRKTA